MSQTIIKDTLLDVAERLFLEHGYAAVTLRQLAKEAGIHHATLYHHAPGGKAELFVAAMQRNTERHTKALQDRVARHENDLRASLVAIADWVLSQPAANHARMLTTDLSYLEEKTAKQLAWGAYNGLVKPILQALQTAKAKQTIQADDATLEVVAAALFSALQGLEMATARYTSNDRALNNAERLIDVLLQGLIPR